MIVWLASYPRSGNSLAQLALLHLFGRRSTSVYADAFEPASFRGLLDRRPLDLLDALDGPVFAKTHEAWQADDPRPALYLVRDGRDALVSHAHFAISRRGRRGEFEQVLRGLLEGPGGSMGTWSENVRAWRSRPAPTALLRYEDLRAEPAALRPAAAAVGVELPPPRGELPGFSELSDLIPAMFRTGQAGSWRSEMPADLEELFWRLHGEAMEALGYER